MYVQGDHRLVNSEWLLYFSHTQFDLDSVNVDICEVWSESSVV